MIILCLNKQGRPVLTNSERENDPQTKLLTEHSIEVSNTLSGELMDIIIDLTFLATEE